MKETWYYLDSGECSPAYNMALDEALLNWQSRKLIPPTLRFYTWNPSTLSIGYFQKKDKINLDGVREHGLGFVRRLTGGRAVFHDQELTYSVVVSEDHPEMPKTVTEAYRVISRGVLEGFRELGLDANFSIPDKQVSKAVQSAVCFDEPSWYELVVGGRKAAGSAQTRQKGVILQHGAIPMDVDEDKLFDLFVYPTREARMRAQEGFVSKAAAINRLLNEPVLVSEAQAAFKAGFEKGLNIELEPFSLSAEQEEEVRGIAEERYGSDEWTYLR